MKELKKKTPKMIQNFITDYFSCCFSDFRLSKNQKAQIKNESSHGLSKHYALDTGIGASQKMKGNDEREIYLGKVHKMFFQLGEYQLVILAI